MVGIKKEGPKFLNNSIMFFILLIIITIIVSAVGHVFDLQATYVKINPITGELEKAIVAVQSLFTREGVRYIIGNAVTNFVSFVPLGMLIMSIMGVGVAYKSGLLPVLFSRIGKKLTKFWLTFIIVFLGIISSFAGEIGYVLLIPLAAMFYLANNRNPLIGILVSFVSVAAGYGINMLVTNLDYSLTSYTTLAASLIDDKFHMSVYSNLFFSISVTIILALFITYLTEKIVIPKLPKYKYDENLMIGEIVITKKEKRGLVLALIGFILILVFFLYMIIPGLPFSGLLLDNNEASYIGKLFGANSYFTVSLIYLISIMLALIGWLYGFGARTIKNSTQFSNILYESLDNVGNILVLIFFASQFIALFKWTNLGMIVTIWLTNLIDFLSFSSIPLIIILFLFVGISNLFLPSSITKWSILSPVIIPLFMKENITPEFTQAIFRISDSATNIITPVMSYFVVFIGFMEFYNKGQNTMTMRKIYNLLWFYSLCIAGLLLFIIVAWYIIGLPIGINAFPTV